MNKRMLTASMLPVLFALTPLNALADPWHCGLDTLKGLYVGSAAGFQRVAGSPPGTPWVPKAIVSTNQFNGAGIVSTPSITIANPPGDSGLVVSPPGSDGSYTVDSDCTGLIQYPNGVAHKMVIDGPRGETVWTIQVNPTGNVFQGKLERIGK